MRRHPDPARGDKGDGWWAIHGRPIYRWPIRWHRDDWGRDDNRGRHNDRRDDDTNAVAALPPGFGIARHRCDADSDQPSKYCGHTQTLPWEHGNLLLPVEPCPRR
jgi:hypothetical protein